MLNLFLATATAAPAQKILYINEVIVDKQGVFQTIEIQGKPEMFVLTEM